MQSLNMADTPILYRIAEFSELFADACLRNSEGELKFLSLYGRDGPVMQFLAALQVGSNEGGITRFNLLDENGERHLVGVGAGTVANLSKFSGRLPRQNLFWPLSQTWLYDHTLRDVDRANRIGWVIHRAVPGEDQEQIKQMLLAKAWLMTCRLSPVALLNEWQQPIQDWCVQTHSYDYLNDPLYPPLGGIQALRVSITDHFLRFVSEGVRTRCLLV